MILVSRFRHLALLAMVALAFPAAAQEVSDTHLKAARSAIAAIKATDQFDQILPQASAALKSELIQKNPDFQERISAVVDEKTFALVARRSDLEREAALAYARVFSEQELTEIANFYNTPAGQKLISDGPIVTRKVIEAAQIWQRGIARDLAVAVGETLEAELKPGPAPFGADGKPADPNAQGGETAGGTSN